MYTITIEDHDTKIIAVHTFETADADAIHNFVDIFCNLCNDDYIIDDDDEEYFDEW